MADSKREDAVLVLALVPPSQAHRMRLPLGSIFCNATISREDLALPAQLFFERFLYPQLEEIKESLPMLQSAGSVNAFEPHVSFVGESNG